MVPNSYRACQSWALANNNCCGYSCFRCSVGTTERPGPASLKSRNLAIRWGCGVPHATNSSFTSAVLYLNAHIRETYLWGRREHILPKKSWERIPWPGIIHSSLYWYVCSSDFEKIYGGWHPLVAYQINQKRCWPGDPREQPHREVAGIYLPNAHSVYTVTLRTVTCRCESVWMELPGAVQCTSCATL